jgi:hypothetical protein
MEPTSEILFDHTKGKRKKKGNVCKKRHDKGKVLRVRMGDDDMRNTNRENRGLFNSDGTHQKKQNIFLIFVVKFSKQAK